MSQVNNIIAIDVESYYSKEYSLSKMSVFNYVHHKEFDAYLVSIHNDSIHYVGPPADFDWTLLNGLIPVAHNASFDEAVIDRLVETGVIKTPAKFGGDWLCTADLAAYLGCKRDLKTAAKFLLGVEVSKAVRSAAIGKKGADLIKDEDMLEYSGDDAINCFNLADRYLCKWPEREQRISIMNRQTARRGFPLDIKLAQEGLATLTPELAKIEAMIPWVWQKDEEGNTLFDESGEPLRTEEKTLSPSAMKDYGKKVNVLVPTSTSKSNEDFLDWLAEHGKTQPWVKAVGDYRSLNTLIGRVQSLCDGYDASTGRFPYEKKYFGATTGRFSGGSATGAGGKFNMENMPRDIMFGVDVRPMFIASPGHSLIITDYSQIEARALLWRAGDESKLAPLRGTSKSVYQAYAEATNIAEVGSDLKKNDKPLYQYVKAKVLAGGYQSGPDSFRRQARVMAGLDLSPEAATAAVYEYRRDNPRVVSYWHGHQDMLAFSTRHKDETHQVELASGRVLSYWHPTFAKRGIEVFQELGSYKTNMYGGKLTENEIQAMCRDILCDAWIALDDAGYKVMLTVHDELVTEVPTDEAEDRAKDIERLVTTCSPWADGLPLAVETIIAPVYAK